jgi:hypothetical protein
MPPSDAQKPQRTKRKDLTPAQLERMDAFIEQQPVTGLTDQAIADIIGCHRVTVARRKTLLAARDSTPELAPRPRPPRRQPPETEPLSARALLDRYKDLVALTPDEQMKLCSIIAATSLNDNAKVAALNALGKFQQMYAPPDRVGPGAPLDDDERVARVADILDAVGITIARRAISRAFRVSLGTDDE